MSLFPPPRPHAGDPITEEYLATLDDFITAARARSMYDLTRDWTPRPPRPGLASRFPVQVITDGGSAGDGSSYCSFTYKVWPLGANTGTDTPIATTVGVVCGRARALKCACSPGTNGDAYYDKDGLLQLWDVDETQTQCVGTCTS